MKINHIITNETIEVGDHFDIELGNLVIESRVVAFTADGVVIEGDEKALALLGLSGALLESISEASLGDYRKKAQHSRALAQIAQVFGRSPEEKEQAAKTVARRERGAAMLAKRDAKAAVARADLAKKSQADAVAKDREQLPQLQAQLAKLEAEFDPYYEYSDDYSVWSKQKGIAASIAGLKQRIAKASEQGVAEGVTPASISKVLRLINRHHPEWFDNYGMGEVEDTVVDLADMGQFSGMSATDALELVGQELESLYGQQGVAEGTSNIGQKVKALYQKVYDQGDDSIDYMYHESPVFAQIWDEYEGELDEIIANVDPSELQVIANELEAYLQGPGLAEGMFGLSAKEKGGIQHITSKISDIPGNWDHQAQTFTERGLEQLKTVLKNNPRYIKYALNLTADDYNADLDEAKYQGRTVQLNKPMQGDVKKFKVYVKDPKTGNIKKVNFGDPNMRIKKSNPKRRKSFRARHHCDTNPGPKTKARYWSCRKW